MLTVSDDWKKSYPGAFVGILILRDTINPEYNQALAQKREEVETNLRTSFGDRESLLNHESLPAYINYYKRYKKTYHVLQQMESVIFKGKKITSSSAIVEAMYMAELKNALLTAGHDVQAIQMPLQLGITRGDERYIGISGKEQITKAGDMMICDQQGVLSSILCGPDFRTRITPATRQVVFAVYAPPGIRREAVEQHFNDITEYVSLFAPSAVTEFRRVY